MLPYNCQECSYNSLATSYLSHHDFPAASYNSFLSQNQEFITCYQEVPKLNNTNAARTRQRSDRHSKIHTKQGLRDRRVRLSLEVAHKFFKLQDLLGFDKASSTVDWLIKQSRVSIEQHLNVQFSDVECGRKDLSSGLLSKKTQDITTKNVWKCKKERRTEARTRARERTMEKKRKLMMERNVEDADQCLFSNDFSKQSSKVDVPHYCQDLGTSNDDYMSSLYEQLNENWFTRL